MTTSHRKQVPKDRCFRTSSSRKDFAYEPLHSEETYCVSLRHMVDVPGVQVVQIPVVVMMHLAICSLLASPGPRCSASWPIWTRRTVAVAFTWLVLLVTMHLALCSLPWFAGSFLDPMVQKVQNPVEFTQVQFLDEVVFMPVVGQRLALMVQTVLKPMEFPQVQFWYEVVFMPVVGQRLALIPVEFPQVKSSLLLWRRDKSPWSR